MQSLDPTVKKETLYVAGHSFIYSLVINLIFLLCGRWNLTVLAGNLIGYLAAVGNFLMIGLTLQQAMTKESQKEIKRFVKVSHALRMFVLLAVGVLACVLPWFDPIATLATFLFPRIAIMTRSFTLSKDKKGRGEGAHEE